MDVGALFIWLIFLTIILAFIFAIVWCARRRLFSVFIIAGGIIGWFLNYLRKFLTEIITFNPGSIPYTPEGDLHTEIYSTQIETYEKNIQLFVLLTILGIILLFIQLILRKRNKTIATPLNASFAIPKVTDDKN